MGWFDGKPSSLPDRKASGAEQDIYASHVDTSRIPSASEAANRAARLQGSGAEQDIYASHIDTSRIPSASEAAGRASRLQGSGAEQDIYASHVDTSRIPSASHVTDRIPKPQGSGAEQDVYERAFGGVSLPSASSLKDKLPRGSGAEQDRLGSHFSGVRPSPTFVGLLQSSVLPSFQLHGGLALVGYGVSRALNRVDGKDWLWPTSIIANAWWSAIGSRVFNYGLSTSDAWSILTYQQKLLLGGATAWGLHLFYRVARKSIERGRDDRRYDAQKAEEGFWNKSLATLWLPEAAIQTLISLPFTLPFRAPLDSLVASPAFGQTGLVHSLAVFLFTSGFTLEVLADAQLASHKKKSPKTLNREGVWSIVRHPNYLGDALIHASFPLLLLGGGLMHPLVLVAPAVNYFFLRFIGGDAQNEAYQEERYAQDEPLKAQEFAQYKAEKNSFWPSADEIKNKWTWVVLAVGAGGALLEQTFRYAL
jgi:steroid 5-alpha reductase family enzyme